MLAMGLDRRGGTYTSDLCPVCGEDRKGEPWVGRRGDPDRMCRRCFTAGREYPRSRSRSADGAERAFSAAAPAHDPSDWKRCPECGQMVKSRGLAPHVARMHRRPAARLDDDLPVNLGHPGREEDILTERLSEDWPGGKEDD